MKFKIKGDIVEWNESIIEFENQMRNIDENEPLEIEVNSYGGDVFLGINIANMIRGHKAPTTVTITGIAASAASIIAASADKVKMYPSSQIMVHAPWTIGIGNSKDFMKLANDLDKIGESVLSSYTHRVDPEVISGLIDEETFLTASEALGHGLADEVISNAEPEMVQSKIFRDEVDKFNAELTTTTEVKHPVAASISRNGLVIQNHESTTVNEDDERIKALEEKLAAVTEKLQQLEPQEEPNEEPVKNGLQRLFLNL